MINPELRAEPERPDAECFAYMKRIHNQIDVLCDLLLPVIYNSPVVSESKEKCSSELIVGMDDINCRLAKLIESIRL